MFCRTSNQGRFFFSEQCGPMIIPHVLFPKPPAKLFELKPCPHIPVQATKIGYYFGMTVANIESPALRQRYEEGYIFEYSVNYITAFMKEKERGSIWGVRAEYEMFLKEFVPKIPSIPMARKRSVNTYLGDLENVIPHVNPWKTFEQIVFDSNERFSRRDGVIKAKKLFSEIEGSFIDAKSLNNPAPLPTTRRPSSSPDEIALQNPLRNPSCALTATTQIPPLRFSSRKRPRVGTTAHRVERESRRRILPPRECKKYR